ncbi:hypothetical protein BgiMline_026436 [Biomphalaria glabrata]|nr:hypothetical protein BgiMline_020920 [Biomphalaria glabrata]
MLLNDLQRQPNSSQPDLISLFHSHSYFSIGPSPYNLICFFIVHSTTDLVTGITRGDLDHPPPAPSCYSLLLPSHHPTFLLSSFTVHFFFFSHFYFAEAANYQIIKRNSHPRLFPDDRRSKCGHLPGPRETSRGNKFIKRNQEVGQHEGSSGPRGLEPPPV